MEKVRYGIIGVGNQGSTYAIDLFGGGHIENGVLAAICDINPAKIDYVKSKTDLSKVALFDDYKAMLDAGVCDAVLVETPHYFHPEMVIECLRRGIHVICEKPAGVYTEAVYEMNRVAEESHALFGMMFNQRTNCVYRKMREMVQSGAIGKLQRVTWIITNWFRTQAYYDTGAWRATWSGEGGGVLINQCPHQLDLLQWVTGEMPTSVNAFCQYGRWHDIEVEDEVTAYLTYKSGAVGVFVTTTGEFPGTNRFEISGTKGKLLCENEVLTFVKPESDMEEVRLHSPDSFVSPKTETITVETDGENRQHCGIINNFTNAILGKEPLFVDGREGVNGVELMNAFELSGWNNGETIAIPVDQKRYKEELFRHIKSSRKKDVEDKVTSTAGTYGSKN